LAHLLAYLLRLKIESTLCAAVGKGDISEKM
jgi:hypothetical protein